jgi:hypothetical protein
LFFPHPSEWPIEDAKAKAQLEWACEETFDTVTSEAGDVEPYLTAHIQIAYEQRLITKSVDPKDRDGTRLGAAFDQRLIALTVSPHVSELSRPDQARLVQVSVVLHAMVPHEADRV